MNSQINAVIIAALAGLALAVGIQASSVISAGYIPPLDASDPFNLRILGFWVVVLGFLPLIFILIAIAVTARRAGLRNSIFTGLGAVAGVSLVIIGAVVAVAIVHSKKEFPFRNASADRASFVRTQASFCATMQQAFKGVPAAAVNAVCSCYGNSLADVTTRTELVYMDLHRTFAPSMVEKTNATLQKCVQLVQGQR